MQGGRVVLQVLLSGTPPIENESDTIFSSSSITPQPPAPCRQDKSLKTEQLCQKQAGISTHRQEERDGSGQIFAWPCDDATGCYSTSAQLKAHLVVSCTRHVPPK